MWRSGRDSNPRDGFPPAPLAGVCLRPLGHRSACSYMRQVKAEQELFPCGGWPQANGVFSYPVTRNQGGCPAVVSGAPGGGLKSHIGDAPVLPDLLSQIPENQEIGSVTAGGACDTRRCHDEIAECGAHAVIPPRENEKPWKTITAGAVARNEALRTAKYLGRALWRRRSGDHRRGRVVTKTHGVKRLGQRLMARDFYRQVAELQVRIAVLNGYSARHTCHRGRGISRPRGKANLDHHTICATGRPQACRPRS